MDDAIFIIAGVISWLPVATISFFFLSFPFVCMPCPLFMDVDVIITFGFCIWRSSYPITVSVVAGNAAPVIISIHSSSSLISTGISPAACVALILNERMPFSNDLKLIAIPSKVALLNGGISLSAIRSSANTLLIEVSNGILSVPKSFTCDSIIFSASSTSIIWLVLKLYPPIVAIDSCTGFFSFLNCSASHPSLAR